jgi:hypothetical protein
MIFSENGGDHGERKDFEEETFENDEGETIFEEFEERR